MNANNIRTLTKYAFAAAALALAGVSHANPIDRVLDGFEIGMSKEQVIQRIASAGGNIQAFKDDCATRNKSEHCSLKGVLDLATFYGHKLSNKNLTFENNILESVSIDLDWGDPSQNTRESYRVHDRYHQGAFRKLRNEMMPLKPVEQSGGYFIWTKGDISLGYNARHKQDPHHPAAWGSFINITVYDNTPKEQTKAKEAGWFSKVRQKFNG